MDQLSRLINLNIYLVVPAYSEMPVSVGRLVTVMILLAALQSPVAQSTRC